MCPTASLASGRAVRVGIQYAEKRQKLLTARRGVLYIDSFAGNLFFFIILWFIGGGCNEKS